ncbi:carbohydrate sulfotransferase 3-like [Gigantopelta aegis]|uniref:carbohydrate sulfotransferase 3-like n=1 Tax=Gigantopelta aegis TaxID=1735272 RepID=UPI001B887CFA|nr:carbohydrate sulfotransferase 3-like [Gigantopelta aegis]
MTSDLEHFNLLWKHFPGQVKVVRYETAAMHPLSEARRLYEFIGVVLTVSDMARVFKEVFAKYDSSDPYETKHRNSSVIPYRWLRNETRQSIRLIDGECRDLYPSLGYLAVDSKYYLANGSLFNETFVP